MLVYSVGVLAMTSSNGRLVHAVTVVPYSKGRYLWYRAISHVVQLFSTSARSPCPSSPSPTSSLRSPFLRRHKPPSRFTLGT